MAIKDQCLQCIHYASGICNVDNASPNYNQMSCESYRKVGISLEKNTDDKSVLSSPNESSLSQNERQSMFAHPFSFEGRIRRTEYWLSTIIVYIYAIIVGFIVGANNGSEGMMYFFLIPGCWFIWAQGAKRCHDRDNSGWYQIIPFYGLWMLFGDGDAYENSYGPDPKGRNVMS